MDLLSFDEEIIKSKLINAEVNKICRSCLTVEGEMKSVFSVNNQKTNSEFLDIQINEMITICTQVVISSRDGLPTQVCSRCASIVLQGFNFRQQAQRADDILRQVLKLPCSKELLENENVPQHEMSPVQKKGTPEQCLSKESDSENVIHKIDVKLEVSEKLVGKEITKTKNSYKRANKRKKEKAKAQHNLDQPTKYDDNLEEVQNIKNVDSDELYVDTNIKLGNIQSTEDSYHPDAIEEYDLIEEDEIETLDEDDMDLKHLKRHLWQVKKSRTDKNTIREKEKNDLYDKPDEPQTCSVCHELFSNVSKLTKHRAQDHGSKKFQCLTCGNGFTTTRGLRIHLRLHTGEKPEICATCGKAFSDPRTLKSHERIHTGDQPFPCSLCGKRFPARLPLEYHMRSHTGERPHKCDICGKSYIQANSLQIHIRTHTGEKPYSCQFCNKSFTNGTSLSLHQLTHNGVKNFQCTICGKRMARSGELTVHLRTHTGEKPFPCTQCNKAFTNSSALRAHMPTHTGIKNFVCSFCGKRVARAMELQIHIRTHTGEKNFSCSFCEKKFSTSSNLRLHERKHTGEKPYVCSVCSRAFADSHVLKNHMRTHTGERPFICLVCGHAFAQQTSLKTHLKSHGLEGRNAVNNSNNVITRKSEQQSLLNEGIETQNRQVERNLDQINNLGNLTGLRSDLRIDSLHEAQEINELQSPISNIEPQQNRPPIESIMRSNQTTVAINRNAAETNLDAGSTALRISSTELETAQITLQNGLVEPTQNDLRMVTTADLRTVSFDPRNNSFDPRRVTGFFTYPFQQQ